MWAGFLLQMLFNGICCCSVVCVSWHQQQRKSTQGFRVLILLLCLCVSVFLFCFFVFYTSCHNFFLNCNWEAKAVDTSFGLWWPLRFSFRSLISFFLAEDSKISAWEIFSFFYYYCLFVYFRFSVWHIHQGIWAKWQIFHAELTRCTPPPIPQPNTNFPLRVKQERGERRTRTIMTLSE